MGKSEIKAKTKASPISAQTYRRVTKAGADVSNAPTAVSDAEVVSLAGRRVLSLLFKSGQVVAIPLDTIEELAGTAPRHLRRVEISPFRDSLHFPAVDVDIYVPGLLADKIGPLVRAEFARAAGSRLTSKKAAAARENGKKGGRPKKHQKRRVNP